MKHRQIANILLQHAPDTPPSSHDACRHATAFFVFFSLFLMSSRCLLRYRRCTSRWRWKVSWKCSKVRPGKSSAVLRGMCVKVPRLWLLVVLCPWKIADTAA